MRSWEGGSKILQSEADLSDLLLISHQSTEDLHPKQTSPGGPVVFFSILHPLGLWKKKPGLQITKKHFLRLCRWLRPQHTPKWRCTVLPTNPQASPSFKVTPTAGVAANPNVHTPGPHWVLGYLAPLKKKRRKWPKKEGRKDICSCMVLQRIIGYLPVKCTVHH